MKALNKYRKKMLENVYFLYFACLFMMAVVIKSSSVMNVICLMLKMYMFFFHVVCISLFFRLCLMTDSGFSWESLFIVLDQLSFLDH